MLWNWRSQRFSGDELEVLGRLRDEMDGPLGAELGALLAPIEVTATTTRLDDLLRRGRFPRPDPDRPAIPWPPF